MSWFIEYRFELGIAISLSLIAIFAYLAYYLYKKQDAWMFGAFVAIFVFAMTALYCYTEIKRTKNMQNEVQKHCEEVAELRQQVSRGDRVFSSTKEIDEILINLRNPKPLGLAFQKDVHTCETGLKLEWLLRARTDQTDRGNMSKVDEIDKAIAKLAASSDENIQFVAQQSARLSPRMRFNAKTRRRSNRKE